MGKIYITLISLCLIFLYNQPLLAQCPDQTQLSVEITNVATFQKVQGQLIFALKSTLPLDKDQYRIRLWDHQEQRYVYDDNNPPFLNITKVQLGDNTISFGGLPEGRYALELHGAACRYARFEVSSLAEIKTN
jgi:hypothetical protein